MRNGEEENCPSEALLLLAAYSSEGLPLTAQQPIFQGANTLASLVNFITVPQLLLSKAEERAAEIAEAVPALADRVSGESIRRLPAIAGHILCSSGSLVRLLVARPPLLEKLWDCKIRHPLLAGEEETADEALLFCQKFVWALHDACPAEFESFLRAEPARVVDLLNLFARKPVVEVLRALLQAGGGGGAAVLPSSTLLRSDLLLGTIVGRLWGSVAWLKGQLPATAGLMLPRAVEEAADCSSPLNLCDSADIVELNANAVALLRDMAHLGNSLFPPADPMLVLFQQQQQQVQQAQSPNLFRALCSDAAVEALVFAVMSAVLPAVVLDQEEEQKEEVQEEVQKEDQKEDQNKDENEDEQNVEKKDEEEAGDEKDVELFVAEKEKENGKEKVEKSEKNDKSDKSEKSEKREKKEKKVCRGNFPALPDSVDCSQVSLPVLGGQIDSALRGVLELCLQLLCSIIGLRKRPARSTNTHRSVHHGPLVGSVVERMPVVAPRKQCPAEEEEDEDDDDEDEEDDDEAALARKAEVHAQLAALAAELGQQFEPLVRRPRKPKRERELEEPKKTEEEEEQQQQQQQQPEETDHKLEEDEPEEEESPGLREWSQTLRSVVRLEAPPSVLLVTAAAESEEQQPGPFDVPENLVDRVLLGRAGVFSLIIQKYAALYRPAEEIAAASSESGETSGGETDDDPAAGGRQPKAVRPLTTPPAPTLLLLEVLRLVKLIARSTQHGERLFTDDLLESLVELLYNTENNLIHTGITEILQLILSPRFLAMHEPPGTDDQSYAWTAAVAERLLRHTSLLRRAVNCVLEMAAPQQRRRPVQGFHTLHLLQLIASEDLISAVPSCPLEWAAAQKVVNKFCNLLSSPLGGSTPVGFSFTAEQRRSVLPLGLCAGALPKAHQHNHQQHQQCWTAFDLHRLDSAEDCWLADSSTAAATAAPAANAADGQFKVSAFAFDTPGAGLLE